MADGNIQAARTRFGKAVQRFTAPRLAVYHDATVTAPSLYHQLASELGGTQGETRTPAKSLPPCWLDAVQLKFDVDCQTRSWCNKPGNTPERLQMLSFQTWRPQDYEHVSQMARTVDTWAEKYIALLDPEAVKYIAGTACPSCGKTTVHRRDSAGDLVRQPSLKVTKTGCACQNCEAYWAPEKFLFLCKLLGFDLPEGVLA